MSRHPSTPLRALLALIALLLTTELASAQTYWPGKNLDWDRKSPQEAGFDAAEIQRAIDFCDRQIANSSNTALRPASTVAAYSTR